MVRSRRKTPLVAVTTAGSDKPFKVDRSERRTAHGARYAVAELVFDEYDLGGCCPLEPTLHS
jgi:hypothetical protein